VGRPAPARGANEVCGLAGLAFLGLVFGFFGSRPERFCAFAMAASHQLRNAQSSTTRLKRDSGALRSRVPDQPTATNLRPTRS
jgi:hypothetical protein